MEKVRRKTTEERQEEIVSAVLRIIAEKGVTSLTTSTLAKEVGVSTGALFRHFPTWDHIFRETVRYALAQLESTFPDPDLPPGERLLQLARNRIHVVGSDPGLSWMMRSEQAFLTLPEDSVDALKAMVVKSKAFIRTTLKDGMDQKVFRNDIEVESLMVPVMGTLHALMGRSGLSNLTAQSPSFQSEPVLQALLALLAPPLPLNQEKENS